MVTINNNLFVEFDVSHNKVFNLAGVDLIRPDMWEMSEDEQGARTFESNVNKLLTHPQVATVKRNAICKLRDGFNPDGSEKYIEKGYAKGEVVFLHYMAKEWEDKVEFAGEEFSLVGAQHVLFKIEGDKFIMNDGVFLGTWELEDAPKTESGIFLTSSDEKIKNDLAIVITHVPDKCAREYRHVKVGDTVLPMDKNNYVIQYEGKEYVVLKDREIIGVKS